MRIGNVSRSSGMLFLLALIAAPAIAHVPFLETSDYTAERPFVVHDIDQSKALYGWLGAAEDVDFYSMPVSEPARIQLRSLVPMCAETQKFRVTYALVGPGLPKPAAELPFELAPGDGAIVVADSLADAAERPTVYEKITGRYYFLGPELEYEAALPGEYRMVVWGDQPGDYVAVIGAAERFSASDMWHAAREMPTLRRARELHAVCTALPGKASTARAGR